MMVSMVQKWLEKVQMAWEQSGIPNEKTTGLFIPNRLLAMVLIGIMLFGLSCGLMGYLWGHRCALERFVSKLEEESFADRISYALYTMNDHYITDFESEGQEISAPLIEERNEEKDNSENPVMTIVDENIKQNHEPITLNTTSSSTTHQELKEVEPLSSCCFVAQLAGFGTLQAATALVQKIATIAPKAHVKEKTGKTAQGKKITWYQVVTGEFEKKDELEKIVRTLCAKEHLKDVRIIEQRKGS